MEGGWSMIGPSHDVSCDQVPGPKRGDIIRQVGHALREKLDLLGELVTTHYPLDH
jgi:hypothetical protein